jgi:hypothetical protein
MEPVVARRVWLMAKLEEEAAAERKRAVRELLGHLAMAMAAPVLWMQGAKELQRIRESLGLQWRRRVVLLV